jgi:hypothetical protein
MASLRDPFLAKLWLRQFKGDAAGMFDLRTLLYEAGNRTGFSRLSDEQVFESVAALLSSGMLHVHASATQITPVPLSTGKAPAAATPFLAPPKPVSASPAAQPDDPATFSSNVSGPVQAAALMSAFCPE